MSDDISLGFDTSDVKRGVNEGVAALDKLLAALVRLEKGVNKFEDGAAESLSAALRAIQANGKTGVNLLDEALQTALERVQAGNLKNLTLVRDQNKSLQALYESRLATVKRLSGEELTFWKEQGASIGKLQKVQLDEYKAGLKDREAAEKAALAESRRAMLAGFKDQQDTAARAKKLYEQLSANDKGSLAYSYKQDSATALAALREFYAQEARIRANAGQQLAKADAPLASIRKSVETDSAATLDAMRIFYEVQARILNNFGMQAKVNGPLSSIRVATAADSESILTGMRNFYSMQERILRNIEETKAGKSALASVRKLTEEDSKAILADMRKFYADRERIMRNIEATRSGAPASTKRVDQQLVTQGAASAMRDYYLSQGAVSNYTSTSFDAKAAEAVTVATNKSAKVAAVAGKAFVGLGGDMNYAHSMARGLASGFNLLWLTWGSLAPLFTGALISNGFMSTAKAGMEVAHTFKTIEVLGGNTTTQMAALNAEMLNLARTGPIGPQAIAEAMKVLSLAGLKANDIVAVTRDVMNFSIAGTTDLKTSAETLVAVSTAFGMGAAGFTRVADVIAKASAESMSSVDSFANAMKTASVINAQYGVSLEDTATGLAALSQLGIQGTAAGTALRNMYADLSGRSAQVAKVLRQQGIELRDTTTGGFKPMLEVVAELNAKFQTLDALGQKNLMQALLSERGAKGIVEMLRLINTEAKDAGSGLSSALAEMQKSIAESAGFAAVSAAKMAQTAKSQFEAVKSTFQASMEEAYKAMEPQLLLIADSLRRTFADPAFVSMMSSFIGGIAQFGRVLAENVQVVMAAATAYAALSAAKFAIVTVSGLAAAATAVQTARTTADTAATTANTAATAANNAAKAGGLLTLARFIPGVNIAVGLLTAGWIAYEFWRNKANDTDKAAAQLYNDNVVKTLVDQTERLRRINDLRAQGISLAEAEARISAQEQGRKAIDPFESATNAAIKNWSNEKAVLEAREREYQNYSTKEAARQIESQRQKVQAAKQAVATAKATEESERKRVQAATDNLVAEQKRANDILNAEMQKKQAAINKVGTGTFALGEGSGRGPRELTNNYTAAIKNNIAALEQQANAQLTANKAQYDAARQILDAQKQADLINQGEYQAKLVALTEKTEAERVDIIKRGQAAVSAEYVRTVEAEIQRASQDITNSRLNGSELAEFKEQRWKALHENLSALNETRIANEDKSAAQIEQIEQESYKRRTIAAIQYAGEIKKLQTESDNYWRNVARQEQAALQRAALDQRWQYTSDEASIFGGGDRAQKAAEYAALEATAAHAAQVEKLQVELVRAQEAYSSVALEAQRAAAAGSEIGPELQLLLDQSMQRVQQLRDLVADTERRAGESTAKAATTAYARSMQQTNAKIASTLGQYVFDALTKSGKDAAKGLKESIKQALSQKFQITINAIIDKGINALLGGGGSGGGIMDMVSNLFGGGGSSGGGFLNTVSNLFGGGSGGGSGNLLSTAANWLSGGTTAAGASSLYALSSGAGTFGATAALTPAVTGTGTGFAANYALTTGASTFGTVSATGGTLGAVTAAAPTTAAATTGAAGAGAGAAGVAAIPVVGWVAAALMLADNLYERGYNRDALRGQGKSKAYDTSIEKQLYGLNKKLGMSEKWATILSGTTRMAHLFGRRLKRYGLEADISGDKIDVENYEYYKGGVFRSNKTVRSAADPDDAKDLIEQIENMREGARGLTQAVNGNVQAIDNFTGRMQVNLKGAESSEEAAKRYADALLDLQYKMLQGAGVIDMTKQEFTSFIESVQKDIEAAGISAAGMSDLLVQGLTGNMSGQEVGYALSDMIVGGIYNSLAQSAAGQVSAAITTQIVQPIFAAMAMGVPVAQAVSKQAIENTIATAREAFAQLKAVFSDPAFRAMVTELNSAFMELGSMTGGAASSVVKFGSRAASASSAAANAAKAAAEEAARKAEQIKDAWRDIADSLLEEIKRIRRELYGETGVSATASAAAEFARANRRARAGDQKAAEKLPDLSQAMLEVFKLNASSMSAYRSMLADTLATLQETRKIIGKKFGIQLPAFADGGEHAGGWSIVGERGMELAYMPPARVYSHSDTNDILSGLGSKESVDNATLQLVVRELQGLRAEVRSGVFIDHKVQRLLDRLTQGNDYILVKAVP